MTSAKSSGDGHGSKRGFASMDETKQREIASKGGKAAGRVRAPLPRPDADPATRPDPGCLCFGHFDGLVHELLSPCSPGGAKRNPGPQNLLPGFRCAPPGLQLQLTATPWPSHIVHPTTWS